MDHQFLKLCLICAFARNSLHPPLTLLQRSVSLTPAAMNVPRSTVLLASPRNGNITVAPVVTDR